MFRQEYGRIHKKNEPIAVFEFNLDDLWFLESGIPYFDGFRKEVVSAIEDIEEYNKLMDAR